MEMEKYLPLETVYRIYKANAGTTIDDKYVRLHGGYLSDDDKGVSSNGLITKGWVYSFTFLDLTDGNYYCASNGLARASDPQWPNQDWYHEPFTTNTIDPFPVNFASHESTAVTTVTIYGLSN